MEHPHLLGSLSPQLVSFLGCTLREGSPVALLRGQSPVLRIIWELVCQEWWDLHIERFSLAGFDSPASIPELLHCRLDELFTSHGMTYPPDRKRFAGCPVAVVAKNVSFPPAALIPLNIFHNQQSSELYVNMMPFDINQRQTLPACCRQYWPLVKACFAQFSGFFSKRREIAYLTIDERTDSASESQHRRGLRVESPGWLPPVKQYDAEDPARVAYTQAALNGNFVPGADHPWDNFLMMRGEAFCGGIYMASNIADTTAVWNCTINDEDGDFIGAHGDTERLRDALGPCARTLEAGELIWMTDRMPHESLPIPACAGSQRRQYFRLVVGEVSAWFAAHSTPNPLGNFVPVDVRVITGDNYPLDRAVSHSWNAGTAEAIARAYAFREMRLLLVECCLGHLVRRMHEYGARSLADCAVLVEQCGTDVKQWDARHSLDGKNLLDSENYAYRNFEMKRFKLFLKRVEEMVPSHNGEVKCEENIPLVAKASVTKRLKQLFGF